MSIILDYLKHKSKMLDDHYQMTKAIKHSGIQGRVREFFVESFLEELFPDYMVGKGIILDNRGVTSQEADIVVYDGSMPIFDYGKRHYFLECGVLAHIEVKSTLDSTQFVRALKVTKSIKVLNRDKGMTIMTGVPQGMTFGVPTEESKIFSCIFAYDGWVKAQTCSERLSKYCEDRSNSNKCVDMVCVLNKYTSIVSQYDESGKAESRIDTYAIGEDSLACFFNTLFQAIYKSPRSIPDMVKYLGI